MLSFEQAKGHLWPLETANRFEISAKTVEAHDSLQAKRKHSSFLKSNAIAEANVSPGDMMKI